MDIVAYIKSWGVLEWTLFGLSLLSIIIATAILNKGE